MNLPPRSRASPIDSVRVARNWKLNDGSKLIFAGGVRGDDEEAEAEHVVAVQSGRRSRATGRRTGTGTKPAPIFLSGTTPTMPETRTIVSS